MCSSCQTPSASLSRRLFMSGLLGIGAAAALPMHKGWALSPQNAITPDEALTRLMDGNARYTANAPNARDFTANRPALAQGQYPVAAILSCADSRVSPELAFDQSQGDLFVVRVAGNFVNDGAIASLEYAVQFLGVPLVLVLGHSGCGAVDAAIKVMKDGLALPGQLPELVQHIQPEVEAAKLDGDHDLLPRSIRTNVAQSVTRLETSDPVLSGFASDGRIRVVGAHYEIATGEVTLV